MLPLQEPKPAREIEPGLSPPACTKSAETLTVKNLEKAEWWTGFSTVGEIQN